MGCHDILSGSPLQLVRQLDGVTLSDNLIV
jgi:hypothetical protein